MDTAALATILFRVTGKVYLIGAGPGDPELITLRGAHVLGLADVVLYDALAHPALLRHARPGAELRSVGKRYGEESFSQEAINAELVVLAKKGLVVARLKGGDPLLFARGAEEVETLAEAKIPFEIVPGIPSPSGSAAYAGISLTHRDLVLERRLHHRHREPRKRAHRPRLVQAGHGDADALHHHGDEAPRRDHAGAHRPRSRSAHAGPGNPVGDVAAPKSGRGAAGRHRRAHGASQSGQSFGGGHW